MANKKDVQDPLLGGNILRKPVTLGTFTLPTSIAPGSEPLGASYDSLLVTADLLERAIETKKDAGTEKVFTDEEIQELKKRALKLNVWRIRISKFQVYQRTAFTWLITALVFTIVVVGLLFSYEQLESSLSRSLASDTAITTSPTNASDTTISASLCELSLQTSAIGVSVLFLSLLFFYLYLRSVYNAPETQIAQSTLVEKLYLEHLLQKELEKAK